MSTDFLSLVSAPPSGRETAVVIDHQTYARAVILQGRPIPWADPVAYAQFLAQAQGLLHPDTTLIDCEVGENARVVRTHAELAVIGPDTTVGPFSYLRPGTELGSRAHVGAFVETKKAIIGEGAKVPHLTYCGDAEVGAGANIGAGTIFANYDGVTKSTSTVGANSFIGSDSVLVAPVHIADGAYVAAGSTITSDVGPGELAVSRGQQRNIPGWVARKRAGTKTAASAEAALAAKEASEKEDGQ